MSGRAGPILVVNPNSNRAVTAGIDAALDVFRLAGAPPIECSTLEEGPFGIESQRDADAVVMPLVRLVEARADAGAVVIACYSDPGLDACRSVSAAPVLGIGEAGVLAAMARADRFGVLAMSEGSIARHRRHLRRMGVSERLAGERALGIGVDEGARGAGTFARLLSVGDALRGDGAEALVLGCAGLAHHRARLEAALGLPVIDPVQAAVAAAMGALLPAGPEIAAEGAAPP